MATLKPALNLMRRLPPSELEDNLMKIVSMVPPSVSEELLVSAVVGVSCVAAVCVCVCLCVCVSVRPCRQSSAARCGVVLYVVLLWGKGTSAPPPHYCIPRNVGSGVLVV